MKQIRAILFDKDGTLFDFHSTWNQFAQAIVSEAAAGDAAKNAQLLAEIGFDAQTGLFDAGSIFAAGTNAELVEVLFPQLQGDALQRKIDEADQLAAGMALTQAMPLPGALETVKFLSKAGYRLGIATNDSAAAARKTIELFGVEDLFDAVFGYDSIDRPKPAPDVIHAFAAATCLDVREIAMVGDNPHDLISARDASAGLAVGVLSGNGGRGDLEALADVLIESVADLPEILESALQPT